MGSGGGSDRDGLAGQGGIVQIGVIAIGGIFHDGNNGAVIFFGDEVRYSLAFQGGHQRLHQRSVLIALLDCHDIGIGGGGTFQSQSVFSGVQTGGDGKVGVDDGVVHILQDVGQLGSFYLAEFDLMGIFNNIQDGSGNAGALFQLDETLILQQQQRAGFIGGIIGNGDFDLFGLIAAGGKGQQQGNGQNNGKYSFQILFHGSFPFCNSDLDNAYIHFTPSDKRHIRPER